MLIMKFKNFLLGDITPFVKYETGKETISKLNKYKLVEINKEDQSFAIFSDGIEFLYDLNQLVMIQYDISGINKINFSGNIITTNTKYEEIINYLETENVNFNEENKYDQKMIITSGGVKIYFSIENNNFMTAIKSFYE